MGAISAPPRSLNSVIVCSKQRTRIRPWTVAEHPDIAVLFTDARNAIMHRGVVDAAGPSPSDPMSSASYRRYSSERRAHLHGSISPELSSSHQLSVNDFKHLRGDVPSRTLTYAHLTKHAFLNQSFNI
jgi:hypothetical protein